MPQATLTITVQDNGSVEVNGPLDNPLLFHGMIGVAADVLAQYQSQKGRERPRVALASGPLPIIGNN